MTRTWRLTYILTHILTGHVACQKRISLVVNALPSVESKGTVPVRRGPPSECDPLSLSLSPVKHKFVPAVFPLAELASAENICAKLCVASLLPFPTGARVRQPAEHACAFLYVHRALLYVPRPAAVTRRCITSGGDLCVSYVESLCTDHWGCSPLGEARGLARRRPTEPAGALGGRRRGLGQGTLSESPTDITPERPTDITPTPTPDQRDPSPNPSPSPSPNPSPRPNLILGEGTLAREPAYGRPPWPGPRSGRAAVHALDRGRDGRGPG